MSSIEKLTNLLTKEIIPDIEEYIDELFEQIASKKADNSTEEEFKELKELHIGFKDMLDELNAGEIEEEEAKEILEDIFDMREKSDKN